MAFRWRADDGPIIVVIGSFTASPPQVAEVVPPPTKLIGSAHAKLLTFNIYKDNMNENHCFNDTDVDSFGIEWVTVLCLSLAMYVNASYFSFENEATDVVFSHSIFTRMSGHHGMAK